MQQYVASTTWTSYTDIPNSLRRWWAPYSRDGAVGLACIFSGGKSCQDRILSRISSLQDSEEAPLLPLLSWLPLSDSFWLDIELGIRRGGGASSVSFGDCASAPVSEGSVLTIAVEHDWWLELYLRLLRVSFFLTLSAFCSSLLFSSEWGKLSLDACFASAPFLALSNTDCLVSLLGANSSCSAASNSNLSLKISGDSLGIFGERFPLEDKFVLALNPCLRFTGDFLAVGEWTTLK